MSRRFLIISLFFISTAVVANIIDFFEVPIEGDLIAKNYRLGRFLIYDCAKRHFVCADFESFENCKDRRQYADTRLKRYLDCTPLKEFDDVESCVQKQYHFIHSINDLSFCIRN